MGKNRSEKALIILDMTNAIAHPKGAMFEAAAIDIIPFLKGELSYFRERMRPVVFCNTASSNENGRDVEPVDFNNKIIHQLLPREKEICIRKTQKNAFFKTNLLDVLQGLNVTNLTIVGAFSSTSVLATAAAALEYGFSVVVPETCVCAKSSEDQAAALRLINLWVTSVS